MTVVLIVVVVILIILIHFTYEHRIVAQGGPARSIRILVHFHRLRLFPLARSPGLHGGGSTSIHPAKRE